MEKKITFELTVDQITVIRELLTTDTAVSKFGTLNYEGDGFVGDACWLECLELFKKANKARNESGMYDGVYRNGFCYNQELNTLYRHWDKNHEDKDYWRESVILTKILFGVE